MVNFLKWLEILHDISFCFNTENSVSFYLLLTLYGGALWEIFLEVCLIFEFQSILL